MTQELTKGTGGIENTCPLSHQFKCDPKLLTSECHLLASAWSLKEEKPHHMHTKSHHNCLLFLLEKRGSNEPQNLAFPPPTSSTALSCYKPMSEIYFPKESFASQCIIIFLFVFWHESQLTLKTQRFLFYQNVIGQAGWCNEYINCTNIINISNDNNCWHLLSMYDVSGTVRTSYIDSMI